MGAYGPDLEWRSRGLPLIKNKERNGRMTDIFKDNRVCVIMRNLPTKDIKDFVKAVSEGGIKLFEVTMNTEDALQQIRLLRAEFGSEIFVGAGTVLNKKMCEMARDAGAQFFVTPSVNREVLEFCVERKISVLPGIYTASEAAVCLEYGIHRMKFFPAVGVSENYVKALQGPFQEAKFWAVGGVSLENLEDYMARGFQGAGLGSSFIGKELLEGGQWEKIREYVSKRMKEIFG